MTLKKKINNSKFANLNSDLCSTYSPCELCDILSASSWDCRVQPKSMKA